MFSVTVFLIALSFLGYSELAADVGLIQGATLAVFLAFSANARNLILGSDSSAHLKQQFVFRGILLFPLAFAAFYLSGGVVETSSLLAITIIVRRSAEWIAELQINEREKVNDIHYAHLFITTQVCSIALLLIAFGLENKPFYGFVLFVWAFSPVLQIIPFLVRMVSESNEFVHINLRDFLPHVGSSWIIAISTFVLRVLLALLVGKFVAGMLYSAFAIGGMLNAIYTYAVGPSLIAKQENLKTTSTDRLTKFIVIIHYFVGFTIIGSVATGIAEGSESVFFKIYRIFYRGRWRHDFSPTPSYAYPSDSEAQRVCA